MSFANKASPVSRARHDEQSGQGAELCYDKQSGQLAEVRLSENTVHTVDSFGERIRRLVDFAREYGFELIDWSIDDGGQGDAGSDADKEWPSEAPPSGRITRQEIGAFACKVIALWLLVEATINFGGAIAFIYESMEQHPLSGLSSPPVNWFVSPLLQAAAALVLWCLSGVLGRRMVRRDPSPLAGIEGLNFDGCQLMGVAFVVAGIFLAVAGMKTAVYVVCRYWNCLASWPAARDRPFFFAYLGSTIVDFSLGIWLILGIHGIVGVLRRQQGDRPEDSPEDDAK